MPAVRSASGPISVPRRDAPISMGTPSRAMRGFGASGSNMSLTFKGSLWVAGSAEWSTPTLQDRATPPQFPYALK